jgi:pimeloyl-ACP methyl ester carboxylesterase
LIYSFSTKRIIKLSVCVKELFATLKLSILRSLPTKVYSNITSSKEPPLVFIHGYLADPSCFTNLAQKFTLTSKRTVYFIQYSSFISFDKIVEKISKEVAQVINHHPDHKPILIGHSLGGILSAEVALNKSLHKHISQVITLGSPFSGTPQAYIGFGSLAKTLRPQSKTLLTIRKKLLNTPSLPITYILSEDDHITYFITERKWIPAAKLVTIGNEGHLSMLISSKVFTLLSKTLS